MSERQQKGWRQRLDQDTGNRDRTAELDAEIARYQAELDELKVQQSMRQTPKPPLSSCKLDQTTSA